MGIGAYLSILTSWAGLVGENRRSCRAHPLESRASKLDQKVRILGGPFDSRLSRNHVFKLTGVNEYLQNMKLQ